MSESGVAEVFDQTGKSDLDLNNEKFNDMVLTKLKAIHDEKEKYFSDPLNCAKYLLDIITIENDQERYKALNDDYNCTLAQVCYNLVSSGRIDLIDEIGNHTHGYNDPESQIVSTLLINSMFNNRDVMWHISKQWKTMSYKCFETLKDIYQDVILDDPPAFRRGEFLPEYELLVSYNGGYDDNPRRIESNK